MIVCLVTLGASLGVVRYAMAVSPPAASVQSLPTLPDISQFDLGGPVAGTASVLLPDGRLQIYGIVGGVPFFIRLLASGGLDTTFNPSGPTPGIKIVGSPTGVASEARLSMFVRSDGRIVAASQGDVVRYTALGDPDATFLIPGGPLAPPGHVGVNVADTHIAQMSNEKILVSGLSGSPSGIGTMRLLADGDWDVSYDPAYVIESHPTAPASGLFGFSPVAPDPITGGWVAASWYYVGSTLVTATAVYDSNGYLNPPASSGIRGYSEVPGVGFPQVAVDAAGRVITFGGGQDHVCRLTRILADRNLDTSFGSPATDHQIQLAGTCATPMPVATNSTNQILAVTQSSKGVLIHQFNDTQQIGQMLLPNSLAFQPQQLLVDAQQRPLLVASSGNHVVVARFPASLPPVQMVPLVPERLLDTRPDGPLVGYSGVKPAAGAVVELQVTGVGKSQVPGDAAAVMLNVTGTAATATGFVTVWPCGTPRPVASNLNLVADGTMPNLVVVKVGAGGKVCLFTQTGTHLLADINAYIPIA